MSVRVIARIRPLMGQEIEEDVIVKTDGTSITIPNPKNENENFTFPFSAVHDREADQATIFAEVTPTIKHLFKGNDVTIFAYGVTGTGKTHTMRGGKVAVERGIIPRLLSAIYRRGKELDKKSAGKIAVEVVMSYYEIYNDKVFDLFEPPEKRGLAGLPLRENNGKTVVVGLSEKRISTLGQFEILYDAANANRSTFATKLNAHSSRSHAIIAVRVVVENSETGEARIGTISAIDLAGSEDNRRTFNDKDRMTESASINKSLFVLAQCVEAISKKQSRIPYRESKMTRILSLGQSSGMTLMILNIAPTRQYHQDTLSSLNFANRTKKIEVKEVENPVVRVVPKVDPSVLMQRPATRQVGNSTTSLSTTLPRALSIKKNHQLTYKPLNGDKQPKPIQREALGVKKQNQNIRSTVGPSKLKSIASNRVDPIKSEKAIAELVERKVEEILAAKALNENSKPPPPDLSEQVNRRLEELERKLETNDNARAEGLTYLVLAKQHIVRGETLAALKMYELALPFFPDNERLLKKISAIREERYGKQAGALGENQLELDLVAPAPPKRTRPFAVFIDPPGPKPTSPSKPSHRPSLLGNSSHRSDRTLKKEKKRTFAAYHEDCSAENDTPSTPRTSKLLKVINSKDVAQIKMLKGVGQKRAEALVALVCERQGDKISTLRDLAALKGVGNKIVETMRSGLAEDGEIVVKVGSGRAKANCVRRETGCAYEHDEEYVPGK